MKTLFLICIAWLCGTQSGLARPVRLNYDANDGYLAFEVLTDDLVKVEISASRTLPDLNHPLKSSPMVVANNFNGPHFFNQKDNGFQTANLTVSVEPTQLCFTVDDHHRGYQLTRICPFNLARAWKGLSLDSANFQSIYGLAQNFTDPRGSSLSWDGQLISPGPYGNELRGFFGGATGFTQLPVLYALGPDLQNFAMFFDHPYKLRWDFRRQPWRMETWGDRIRWYIIAGDNLKALRKTYTKLTGHPKVPRRKTFGHWVSEFGYDSWQEIDEVLASLKSHHFPVEGFGLDLQWYGGRFGDPDHSRMGTLAWDLVNFPSPQATIEKYRKEHDLEFMLIEQPYVDHKLKEHRELEARGFLVRDCQDCGATYIDHNPWWGRGGIIDFTNPMAGVYWHTKKRQPQINMGIYGHWTDLGEPEMYNPWAWYYGFPEEGLHAQGDIHNLYNLNWAASIVSGYDAMKTNERPFILTRSGTSGIQRYYTTMWSGDIASNFTSLNAHLRSQAHLSLAGIDYYGSDAGGFYRPTSDNQINELYTRWFANSAMIDIPLRPHVWNLDGNHHSAPSLVGDRASNLANVELRYRLIPYLYSLAHHAHNEAKPIFPPLFYEYQADANLREITDEKLIGPSLLAALATNHYEYDRWVYLPQGRWIDFHANSWVESHGGWLTDVPFYRTGRLTLPLFVREGSIIPMTTHKRKVNDLHSFLKDLTIRIYASTSSPEFTLFEDDGHTRNYEHGKGVSRTVISQKQHDHEIQITIRNEGSPIYPKRDLTIEISTHQKIASSIKLDKTVLPTCATDIDSDTRCWTINKRGFSVVHLPDWQSYKPVLLIAQLTNQKPSASAYFVCKNIETTEQETIAVVGNTEQLGFWNPEKALPLYKTSLGIWTLIANDLPPDRRIEWKCIKKHTSGEITWEPGANNILETRPMGYSGKSEGVF